MRALLLLTGVGAVAGFRLATPQAALRTWRLAALAPSETPCEWAEERYGDAAKDSVSDATTTAAVLADVWSGVEALLADEDGTETSLLRFPAAEALAAPEILAGLMEHLEDCKDVCERFGAEVYAIGHHPVEYKDRIESVVLELRRPRKKSDEDGGGMFWEAGGDEADADAGWDDWDEEDSESGAPISDTAAYAPGGRLDADSLSDEELVTINKEWVQAVVAGLGVCPFATSADRAGLPLGDVFYPVDRTASAEVMYATFWSEVVRVQQSKERSLSTTMLVAPKFCLASADGFDAYANTLTKALEPLALDEGSLGIQLVFFHPAYEFRDGADRMDAGVADAKAAQDAAAGNFARRSPHPMINILRTPQVRAAQRVIPTGAVYVQNQRTLGQVGVDKLQDMLEDGEWEGLKGYKVDRRQGLWKKAATVTAAVEAAQGSREGLERFDFDVNEDLAVADPDALFLEEDEADVATALGEGEEPMDLGALQDLVFEAEDAVAATDAEEAVVDTEEDALVDEEEEAEATTDSEAALEVEAELQADEDNQDNEDEAEDAVDASETSAPDLPTSTAPVMGDAPAADDEDDAGEEITETIVTEEEEADFIASNQRARAEAADSGLTREQREEMSWMIELLQRRVSLSQGDMQTLRLQSAAKATPENVQRFAESALELIREARLYDERNPDSKKR